MDSFDKNKEQGSGGSRPSDKGGRGWGAGHPDTEIRGGPQSQKNFFRPFGPQFGLKIRGGARAPRTLPLDPPLQGTNKRE